MLVSAFNPTVPAGGRAAASLSTNCVDPATGAALPHLTYSLYQHTDCELLAAHLPALESSYRQIYNVNVRICSKIYVCATSEAREAQRLLLEDTYNLQNNPNDPRTSMGILDASLCGFVSTIREELIAAVSHNDTRALGKLLFLVTICSVPPSLEGLTAEQLHADPGRYNVRTCPLHTRVLWIWVDRDPLRPLPAEKDAIFNEYLSDAQVGLHDPLSPLVERHPSRLPLQDELLLGGLGIPFNRRILLTRGDQRAAAAAKDDLACGLHCGQFIDELCRSRKNYTSRAALIWDAAAGSSRLEVAPPAGQPAFGLPLPQAEWCPLAYIETCGSTNFYLGATSGEGDQGLRPVVATAAWWSWFYDGHRVRYANLGATPELRRRQQSGQAKNQKQPGFLAQSAWPLKLPTFR